MAFILVGAIFVGSMQTSWEGQITPPYSKSVKHSNYMDQKIRLEKGDELGRFNMGSTVIILMPNDFPNLSLEEGQALKMGQSIT
jgi:phosphatidylserine decarboxylase